MKARYNILYGVCVTEYSNGTLYPTPSLFFTESVQPGPSVNNGRRRPWSNWSYSVLHRTSYHSDDDGFIKWKLPSGVTKFTGSFGSSSESPRLPDWERDAVYNSALGKLNSKVRGDLDLGVSLAELGSTKRMFKAIGKTLKHAIKLKPPGGFGSSKDVANGYLQYKYGWKPLMSDVFGVADEMIRVTLNAVQHVKAGSRFPIGGNKTGNLRYINGTSDCEVEVTPPSGQHFGYYACHFQLAFNYAGFRLDRFSSLNPVSLAWELIPYSFVVDWFYDVGSYLRDLETGLLYNAAFVDGYCSEIFRYTAEERCNSTNLLFPPYIVENRGVVGDIDYVSFLRTKLTSYPLPRKPTFSVDLSSGQLFSAAALLRQLISK